MFPKPLNDPGLVWFDLIDHIPGKDKSDKNNDNNPAPGKAAFYILDLSEHLIYLGWRPPLFSLPLLL